MYYVREQQAINGIFNDVVSGDTPNRLRKIFLQDGDNLLTDSPVVPCR